MLVSKEHLKSTGSINHILLKEKRAKELLLHLFNF